jgi:hypothetical protein
MLCVGGAFLPLHALYQNFIISRGRSDIYLFCIALMIVLQITLTLSLASFGITAMVAAFAALNVVFTACWHFALRRIHPLSTIAVLKDTLPFALVATAVMVVTHFITLLPFNPSTLQSFNPSILLLSRIVIAGLLYLLAMRLLHATVLRECLQFILKKNGRDNHHHTSL